MGQRLEIRLLPGEKAAYDIAADAAGMERSDWIRHVLNEAAQNALKDAPMVHRMDYWPIKMVALPHGVRPDIARLGTCPDTVLTPRQAATTLAALFFLLFISALPFIPQIIRDSPVFVAAIRLFSPPPKNTKA